MGNGDIPDIPDTKLFPAEELQFERDSKLAGLARERMQQAITFIMGTPQGRAVMWDLFEYTQPMGKVYERGTSDMLMKEGKRHVGLRYFSKVFTKECMPLYLKMLEEASQVKRKLVENL